MAEKFSIKGFRMLPTTEVSSEFFNFPGRSGHIVSLGFKADDRVWSPLETNRQYYTSIEI